MYIIHISEIKCVNTGPSALKKIANLYFVKLVPQVLEPPNTVVILEQFISKDHEHPM